MHFCVVHQATRSGIENRVANRACRAIQPSISSSIQPTERAPSDTWRGNSPFAIRTCVRTSTWLAAGGPIEPTGQCYRASHGTRNRSGNHAIHAGLFLDSLSGLGLVGRFQELPKVPNVFDSFHQDAPHVQIPVRFQSDLVHETDENGRKDTKIQGRYTPMETCGIFVIYSNS